MSDVKLNWSTAKVEDSKLTVHLDGDLPSGWKDSFDAISDRAGRLAEPPGRSGPALPGSPAGGIVTQRMYRTHAFPNSAERGRRAKATRTRPRAQS